MKLGIFSKTTDSSIVEVVGMSGLDFIILDQEHGPIGLETLLNHVRASKLTGVRSFVRVKGLDPTLIGSALDAGADGVQVPNITTKEQAKKAVESARFFPTGSRGVCRFVRAAQFGTMDKQEYFQKENQKLLALQVEGLEGIANLDDILKVEGFDILFAGPYDLSQSLGFPGQVDHPEVIMRIQELAVKTKRAGKIPGTFADNLRMAATFKKAGFEYIAYSVDLNIFQEACRKLKLDIETA